MESRDQTQTEGVLGQPRFTSAFPPRDTAVGGYLEPIRAGGAVLWRDGGGAEPEIVLIRRPDRDDWTLPKGKLKNGEHLITGAVREVREETGLIPVLGRRLPPQRYLKDGWPKQVEWWAATPAEPGGAIDYVPNEEVDVVEWVPMKDALARLTYEHDVHVLDNFRAGPAETFPVIVLRHLSAGEKRAWRDNDLLRPLDEAGRADALALPRVLASYGRPRAVSSAAARCTESLLPYSVESDVPVRTERAFTVRGAGRGESPEFDVEAAREAFEGVLSEGRPTVVCTHGELVPHLMREALDRLGAPVSQQLGLRKGSFWVVHVAAGGVLAGVERHAIRG
ncbi:DNA mismatch repair protein MutT [Nocardiopsis sp. CNR-923]|uniref:NUDIX hydrolase n=1 Tax=Nocardiopsis sp. CNR-923 TaxID=1904965 RepID=UPI00095DA838|nr:NUDIX hydrolase [Nocardiopsis sp. CNR-923]OLT27863.1 DNA mismatch repair protein MutT [Nocardiopsis sp. CNR-923]